MRDGLLRRAVAVLLAGSGSDHVFVTAAFGQPLAALGIRLVAPPPRPGRGTVAAMWHELDRASATPAAGTELLVGGISLGAHVATGWAARHPGRCAGLLLALPAWLGAPGAAPAAVAAADAARAVRRDGVHRTLGQIRAGAPGWLADELDRSWRWYGSGLADSLHAAAGAVAPTAGELRAVQLPAGIAALTDDPLHPLAVARRWAGELPRAAMVTTSLRAVGRDHATLGRAAVLAWLRAAHPPASPIQYPPVGTAAHPPAGPQQESGSGVRPDLLLFLPRGGHLP